MKDKDKDNEYESELKRIHKQRKDEDEYLIQQGAINMIFNQNMG